MKHVLIIHYHFLPVHNVAVKRLMGYAMQLPAFGWAPLVLTREWRGLDQEHPSWGLSWEPDLERAAPYPIHRVAHQRLARSDGRARRTPYRHAAGSLARHTLGNRAGDRMIRQADGMIRKSARLWRMLSGNYPDEFISWAGPAVAEGIRLAGRRPIDAIISYCPPETNHVVGSRLARRLGVPWVPFFGDLYGFLKPSLPPHSVEGFLRMAWHRRCLAPAAACAAVSPAMVDFLSRTYRKPVELVHTGFNHAGAVEPAAAAGRERLVVSHIGSLYPGDQRPEVFLDGLDRLLERHPEVERRLEVRFVGSKCDDRLRAMLDGRRGGAVCRVQPKVDSRTALSLVRNSDVLLAFTCTAHRDRFGTLSYPTKIFEAFGAQKPVLAVPADGDWVDDLLARTGGGVSARDAEEVAARLWEWFSTWTRDGLVPYHGRPDVIAEFSLERQVERLARLLDSVS